MDNRNIKSPKILGIVHNTDENLDCSVIDDLQRLHSNTGKRPKFSAASLSSKKYVLDNEVCTESEVAQSLFVQDADSTDKKKDFMGHWLFSDDPSVKFSEIPFIKPQKGISFANNFPLNTSNDCETVEQGSSFKLASGRACKPVDFEKIGNFKNLLGLDDFFVSENADSGCVVVDKIGRDPRIGALDKSVTAAKEMEQRVESPIKPKLTSLVDYWENNCVLTGHCTLFMSPAMLSRLWNVYGNPFTIRFDSADNFTFICYKAQDSYIKIGGLKEIDKCFRQLISCIVKKTAKLGDFDKKWVERKYRLFSVLECRRYRKEIFTSVRSGKKLEEALLNVQLPRPMAILKGLLKSFRLEYSGKYSILLDILQGDSPIDLPVVVRVEDICEDHIYISDGYNALKAVAADSHVANLIDSRKIWLGSKILLSGIFVDSNSANSSSFNAVIALNYNSISSAKLRRIGAQMKMTNANIRELKGGAGIAAIIDVTVLNVFPTVFKVFYKSSSPCKAKSAIFEESDFRYLCTDSGYNITDAIENVSVMCNMVVVDTITLIKLKNMSKNAVEFEKLLTRSCAFLTLKNVSEEITAAIKPTMRLTVTHLHVQNASANSEIFWGAGIPKLDVGNLSFRTTIKSRLKVNEEESILSNIRKMASICKSSPKIEDEATKNMNFNGLPKSIFQTLVLGEPVLSVSSCGGDAESAFYGLLKSFPNCTCSTGKEMFLGQICCLTGLILDVGEILSLRKHGCYFMIFVFTTSLNFVSIKVASKYALIPDENGTSYSIYKAAENSRSKLSNYALNVALDSDDSARDATAVLFMFYNLQYSGYDKEHDVHNFSVTAERLVWESAKVLDEFQSFFCKRRLVSRGSGQILCHSALKELGDTFIELTCKMYALAIVKQKIKVYELTNADSTLMELCKEFIERGF